MTPGQRLYEAYIREFGYRWGGNALPWRKLPTWHERNSWEKIAEVLVGSVHRNRGLSDSIGLGVLSSPRRKGLRRRFLTFMFCSWKG